MRAACCTLSLARAAVHSPEQAVFSPIKAVQRIQKTCRLFLCASIRLALRMPCRTGSNLTCSSDRHNLLAAPAQSGEAASLLGSRYGLLVGRGPRAWCTLPAGAAALALLFLLAARSVRA
jgi:hypothetical protein